MCGRRGSPTDLSKSDRMSLVEAPLLAALSRQFWAATATSRTAVRDEEHLQRQIAAINDYCEERGIVVAKIVTARGQSGMRPFDTRGGLIVKEAIENDTIDMLIAKGKKDHAVSTILSRCGG